MAHAMTDSTGAWLCGALLAASLVACPGGQDGTGGSATEGDTSGDATAGESSTSDPTGGAASGVCGEMPPEALGFAICAAVEGDRAEGKPGGDVNGDGLADIIVETQGGPAYVVFGKTDTAPVYLAELTGDQGIVLDDSSSDDNLVVIPAGDVNGDGFDDLFVGFEEKFYAYGRGSDAYVVFGGPDVHDVDLAAPAPSEGVRLFAGEGAYVAWMEALGDVNGDGFADLAFIEGYCCSLDINVVFGAAEPKEVTEADVEAGVGGVVVARASWTDVAAGDINGDGIRDIVVEQIGDSLEGAHHDGPLHVIFGGPDLHEVDLYGEFDDMTYEYLPPVLDGFTIFGPGGHWDFDIGTGADLDGDGLDDLALVIDIGSWNGPPEVVAVFGKEDTSPVALPTSLTEGAGFPISLELDDPERRVEANLGPDLNGDGLADITLVVGNRAYDDARRKDRAYVIFGKAGTEPVVAGEAGSGFAFDAAPPGETSGMFGGWAQVDGKGDFDLIVSAHEGGDEAPERARIFVYFDKAAG